MTATTEITEPTTGFRLLPPAEGQLTSAIQVGWCVSDEITQHLAQREVDDAYALIVVTHDDREVGRYVFPIEHQQGFVHFHRPGVHTLHSTIVWGWSRRSVRRELLERRSRKGSYSRELTETAYPDELEELRTRGAQLEAVLQRVRAGQPEHELSAADAIRSRITDLETELESLRERLARLESQEPQPDAATDNDTVASDTPVETDAVEDAEQIVRSAREEELSQQISAIKARIRAIEEGTHPLRLRRNTYVHRLLAEDTVEVNVPTGVFGKPSLPPTRWLAQRNQWFWIDKPGNPCITRRRAFVNFFSMAVWIPFQLVKEVALLLMNVAFLLGGFRGIQWRLLRKPWNYGFLDGLDSIQPSWFTHRRVTTGKGTGDSYELRRPIWFVFNPAPFLVIILAYLLLRHIGWLELAQNMLAVAVAGLLIAAVMSLLPPQPEELQKMRAKERQRWDARNAAHRVQLQRRYAALTCSTDPQEPLRTRPLGVVWENFKIRTFACLPLAEDD
jgi:hypothetical protein